MPPPPTTPSSMIRHPYLLRISQTTSSSSPAPPAVDGSVEGPQHLQFVVAVLGNDGLDPAAIAVASPAPKLPSRWRRCASTENLRGRVTRWSHLPPFLSSYENQKNRSLTFEDLANHNHKNDCWLIINGK
ncbi:hypothetical protein PIB30_085754, partial [Stylosanthes scabra]|nr:hypothetical protein [Stylosanthes scabra]